MTEDILYRWFCRLVSSKRFEQLQTISLREFNDSSLWGFALGASVGNLGR